MSDYVAVWVTCASREEGQRLAQLLVERRLAACVNLIDGVESLFRWRGAIDKAKEILLIAKSRAALLPELTAAIKENHSYETPEIIALPIVGGDADYLNWLETETRSV